MSNWARDLQKMMDLDKDQIEQQDNPDLILLKSKLYSVGHRGKGKFKPFYILSEDMHERRYKSTKGQDCFWHIISAPTLNGKDMPMLPYQKLLYRILGEYKCHWIKKSRGIGVSEFLLRYLAYQIMTGEYPPGSRACLIVGPRIDLAEDLCDRFKGLFRKNFPNLFDKTRSTLALLNGVKVEAFPSHNVSSMRGLTNVKFIMSDESDYYPRFQQQEVRAVMEGYIGKPNSDPTICIVSTPKAPGGLMQQIELEQNSLYYKHFYDYTYGLESPSPIYSIEQIEKAKLSPQFPTEYEGKYLGLVGNVLSQTSIENCQRTGIEFSKTAPIDDWSIPTNYILSVDIGWGSSNTAIIVSRFINGKVQIIYSQEFHRALFQDIIDEIWRLKNRCGGGNAVVYRT
jgi:hypothetical protein